ncbi:MAG: hypothetical protein APR55_03285 [Methanolinea sp. SDB]|nr:MAG: hypothetical protein APR55_03285 [Methanolinea sp. SDB]
MRKIFWVTGFFLLVCLSVFFLHLSTNTEEFSRYNMQWNGTSQFFGSRAAMDATEIRQTSDLAERDASFLLIIAPGRPFDTQESRDLHDFLTHGNVIFLADETGAGNTLLEGLDSEIRVFPANLTSVERQYGDHSSVIAHASSPDPLNSGFTGLVLNSPSYVKGGTPVFVTSLLTWTDDNGNGRIDETEGLGRYTVLSREYIGEGTLYVLSDPSVFINGMQDASRENSVFLGRLAGHDNPGLLIEQDHSSTAKADALVLAIINMKRSKFMMTVLFILVGAGASLYAWKRYTEVS